MGKATEPPAGGGDIEPIDLKAALEERYLAYALSTIMGRALPDVRDGLKPVHRRIVHAMRILRLDPGQGYKKCARIVGDVMGKFHPHGDASIYDALVRLSQDFAIRYPLIDGQGNFGNVDGDSPAAMRYTEARMTDVATLLLRGIDEDAVDFKKTYNEEEEEPIVLPGAFPNLLANGSSGIAVGMATSIPPHNAAELCDAALKLIENPDATTDALLRFVQGPDLPTGGVIVDNQAQIREAYDTGRGSFRVRARWETEDQGRGGYVVVVTEIPYQVQKSRLIEKIAELLLARKLPLLGDIRDESAEDVRIVIEPKSRTVDPELLMESLFRLTDLESRIPLNMNVLSGGKVPRVMSLKDVLAEWLAHQRDVLVRRSRFRLAQIERRLEILSGYLIAFLNLDEVIRIIREEDEPKTELMRTFELTDTQAEAILNMRLRSLRKLEEFELKREFDTLTGEKAEKEALLASDERQWAGIAAEVREVRETYSKKTKIGRRRTMFADAPNRALDDITVALIEKEPITVVLSKKGFLRGMKGHLADFSSLAFREGDGLQLAFHAMTTDKLLFLSTGGRAFTHGADKLPGGRGQGEPIRLAFELEDDQDIALAFVADPERRRLLVSSDGNGFVASEADMLANTRKGKQLMNVAGKTKLALAAPVGAGDHVAIVGENRKLLVFPLVQVPQMTRGKGVRLQRYKDGGLSDARVFAMADGLTWTDSAGRSFTRSETELLEWRGDRAQAGRLVPKGFPKTNRFDG
ncbi:DNA topoisomerase IV, A subunit [Aurantimonas manganoxydans SI85-9A1]|uniref:DNA topoisomerase 4 subunit A n=2 Tax=Aurantimonas manganoxydans TaxID=651183 RepID=Q1YIB0_AURMS|nr:DNA topoisomerase IV subunit A [Aurantimonas manganoxydans]EAS50207.1 DNA topoisomerase IV, A subunit [Aurantimonas manganoxydans SI85-9A1]BAT29437.1 DNA topoisomerase IV subunit A [Aurantimonas manganoxydans SI85-9A1]